MEFHSWHIQTGLPPDQGIQRKSGTICVVGENQVEKRILQWIRDDWAILSVHQIEYDIYQIFILLYIIPVCSHYKAQCCFVIKPKHFIAEGALKPHVCPVK